MPRAKVPAGFASKWHYQRYKDDLARELQGAVNRKAELEDVRARNDPRAAAAAEVKAIRAEARRVGSGSKAPGK